MLVNYSRDIFPGKHSQELLDNKEAKTATKLVKKPCNRTQRKSFTKGQISTRLMEINASLLASQPLPQIQYAVVNFNPSAEYSSECDRNYCLPEETEQLFLSRRRKTRKSAIEMAYLPCVNANNNAAVGGLWLSGFLNLYFAISTVAGKHNTSNHFFFLCLLRFFIFLLSFLFAFCFSLSLSCSFLLVLSLIHVRTFFGVTDVW